MIAETGKEEDATGPIFAQDVPTSGKSVEFAHREIHQHDIGFVPSIAADRVEAGIDDVDNFMAAGADHFGKSLRENFIVIGDEDAHACQSRRFHALDGEFFRGPKCGGGLQMALARPGSCYYRW